MIDLLIVGVLVLVLYGLRRVHNYFLDKHAKAYELETAPSPPPSTKDKSAKDELDELYDALRAVAGDIHLPETDSVQNARSVIRNENR